MKKLMVACCAVMLGAVSAQAECFWSTWFNGPAQDANVKGCVLGLASEVKDISGAQVDVCISKATAVNAGAQVSFGYNRVVTLKNGCQVGFWNNAKSAALQFGLICHNETGFLPWFVFFNFDSKQFGSKAK